MKAMKTMPLVLALCLLGSSAFAEDSLKPSLKGLTAVKLNISMSQELVNAGVQGARLRTQLELQLRRAGLKVDPTVTGPNLYVEITGVQGPGTNTFACCVSLSLSETVKDLRNGEDVIGTIWGPNQYVLYLVRDLESTLFENTRDRVDEFLNDWLRVNPR